ncbi:hypothetical protein BDB00DRAFT_834588, partial [Zychaea mexicana]|uniref:uncharacterized protein n=1 Tax=Zychaea mexicana TaxID=64656 RepID=UPI0022FDC833
AFFLFLWCRAWRCRVRLRQVMFVVARVRLVGSACGVFWVCLAVSAFVRRWGVARASQWMVS